MIAEAGDDAVAVSRRAVLAELGLRLDAGDAQLDTHDRAQLSLDELDGCVGNRPRMRAARFVPTSDSPATASRQCGLLRATCPSSESPSRSIGSGVATRPVAVGEIRSTRCAPSSNAATSSSDAAKAAGTYIGPGWQPGAERSQATGQAPARTVAPK